MKTLLQTKMPCNCIVDKPEYPQNEDWGPIFWSLYHILAERAGQQTNPISESDEMRAWPLFIKSMIPVIHCTFCRDHATEYLLKNPFVLPVSYSLWHSYTRIWFWKFHEEVNTRLGKPSLPFDQLAEKYRDTNQFQFLYRQIEAYVLRAVKMDGVSLFAWNTWKKQLILLRGVCL